MSDSAAPSAAPSPATPNNQNDAQELKPDGRGWHRPAPAKEGSAAADRVVPPQKTAPAKADVKKTEHAAARKENDTSATQADDDPEEEWDDGKGGKVKAKRSALREAFARKTEIERESHDRFQKAADARKAAEARDAEFQQLFERSKEDPWVLQRALIMKRDGLSAEQADEKLNEIAEERLVKQMQRARMTPEEIEQEQLRNENKQLKTDAQKRADEEKQKRYDDAKKLHREEWDRIIGEAMTAAKLPRTRFAAARVAKVLADHFDPTTGKSIDPSLAARIARDVHHTEIRHELSELAEANPQAAIDLLGPKLVKAIIAQEAAKHQEFVPQGGGTPTPPPTPPKPRTPKGPPTLEEARRRLGVRHY